MSGMGLSLVDQLKTRMQWLQTRQKVLAENVANADTPNFRPKDLKPFELSAGGGGVRLEATSPGHLGGAAGGSAPGSRGAAKFETRPSGNAVSLEDEMTRLADTQMDYQTVASLYSKSLGMIKIAIGKKA
ncbi:flagellar basal body rod protein FlgB [Alsobacter soli]|uniref:Flagellar basal body rod protein FlgB n=1 Tax=Alsobacter soli TaxID=2109933 RepID=A0A2T1HRM4_9HYPH|nr:flagellar basal body rod protein FlgB [Alsobacter soli]PSC04300.1 flagellar basal body rod protein FlgB [Alsobacter soli]